MPLALQNKENPFTRGMPFADFIRIVCEIPDSDSNIHFAPQSMILSSSEKVGDELIVDYIGRFEQLTDDFRYVMTQIAPDKKMNLDKWNESDTRGKSYRRYYDDKLAEMVSEMYSEEICRFGYAF